MSPSLTQDSALVLLFMSWPAATVLIGLFSINALISALCSVLLVAITNNHRKRQKFALWLWFTSIAVFIPLFGLAIAIIAALLLRNYGRKIPATPIQRFTAVEYRSEHATAVIHAYGPGWARVRLEQQDFTKRERIAALISINNHISRQANALNRYLLADSMDELRLYAFSLLEKQQNQANTAIYALLQQQQKATTPLALAKIEKQLALHYWQMIYYYLATDELRAIILAQCAHFTEQAIATLHNDAILWWLMAQIYHAQGDTTQSTAALTKAQQLHAPASKVLPFLAEYSFNQRIYSSIPAYLNKDSSLQDIPLLAPLVTFWCTP